MTITSQPPATTKYQVTVVYDTARPSRALTSYSVSLGAIHADRAADFGGATNELRSSAVVDNDRARQSGVFTSLRAAIEAIHSAVDAPFAVFRDEFNGGYQISPIDRKPGIGFVRVATGRHDATGLMFHVDV